jgi:hypothetical protein
MTNDSTTKAKEIQHGKSLDLQVSPSNITFNAEQENSPNMKLLDNHPGEALHVEAAALDNATSIDDEALPNIIENDIPNEVSLNSSKKLPPPSSQIMKPPLARPLMRKSPIIRMLRCIPPASPETKLLNVT